MPKTSAALMSNGEKGRDLKQNRTRERVNHTGEFVREIPGCCGHAASFEKRTRFLGMSPRGEIASPGIRVQSKGQDLSIGNQVPSLIGPFRSSIPFDQAFVRPDR